MNRIHRYCNLKGCIRTTIEDIGPRMYAIHEIKHPSNANELDDDQSTFEVYTNAGFTDDNNLYDLNTNTLYGSICFEYEDEQEIYCSKTTVVNEVETKVCIFKNYIKWTIRSP